MSDARDGEADGAFEWFVFLEAVDKVLNRIAMGCSRGGGRDLARAGMPPSLEGYECVVIVAGDGAFGPGNHEAASRLRLDFPRVSEGSPAGFEL